MYRDDDGEIFLAPESYVPVAAREPAATPAAPSGTRGTAAVPAAPSDRARSVLAAAAHRRLEAWARHALGANGFGAAGAVTGDGKP